MNTWVFEPGHGEDHKSRAPGRSKYPGHTVKFGEHKSNSQATLSEMRRMENQNARFIIHKAKFRTAPVCLARPCAFQRSCRMLRAFDDSAHPRGL